jgi:hypothetical protein
MENNNNALTLEKALESGRVFVLNKSKPKGAILITFVQPGTGKSFVATIPKTWIPIAVSDTVPLRVLQESIDFRSYLKSRMLTLVAREEAEKVLESSDAKDELERIYTSKFAEDSKKKTKPTTTKNGKEKSEEEEDDDEVDVQDFIQEENLLVKDILQRNENNKASVALNELRSVEEELTKSDLEYIIKKTEGKIRTWSEKQLREKYE